MTIDSTGSGLRELQSSNRDTAGHRFSRPLSQGPEGTSAQQQRRDELDYDSGKTLRNYIEIIIRRRWAALVVFVAIFSMAAAYTFTVTPLFNAVATIEFEEKKPKQEDRVYGNPEYDQYKGYLATQLEILKSRSLAKALVAKMNLSESPEFANTNSLVSKWISLVPWLPRLAAKEGAVNAQARIIANDKKNDRLAE